MTEHKSVLWIELFFDLIFVAAIHLLVNNLATSSSFVNALYILLAFIPVLWVWISHTLYTNHFLHRSWLYHFLTFMQMVGVIALVLLAPYIPTNPEWFAWTYFAIKALLVMQYLISSLLALHKIMVVLPILLGYLCSAVLWGVSTLSPNPIMWWVFAMIVDILTPALTRTQALVDTMNQSHLVERFGLLTVITLGEFMLSLTVSASSMPLNKNLLLAMGMSMLVVTFIFWSYQRYLNFATVLNVSSSRIYMYSHIPLVLGLALIGAGYKASIAGEHAPFLLLFGITLYVIANRALGYLISHRLLKRHIFFTLSLLPLLIWYLVVRADPLFMIAVLSICLLIYIVLCEVFVRPDIAEGKHIDRRKKPTKWDDA